MERVPTGAPMQPSEPANHAGPAQLLAEEPAVAPRAAKPGLGWWFALTIFTGAFLLFQVQPLIGKYILPWFGGGPAVWTACMVFFQVLLLGGYAYAHLSARLLPARGQAAVHLLLLLAALAFLPITPAAGWKPAAPGDPTWRILALLAACLGLPYLVLSATGPLMQAWFSRLHPGVSPYRLYALSNAGSLMALISYPFFFEPLLSRKAQAEMWSWGLGAFVILCGVCAVKLWKSSPSPAPLPARQGTKRESFLGGFPPASHESERRAPALQRRGLGFVQSWSSALRFMFDRSWVQGEMADQQILSPSEAEAPTPGARLLWLGLPACASVLLLASTNKMCQDVAVIPFLWVLPLGLYLLSFIICFDSPKWYRRGAFNWALLPALAGVCVALFKGADLPLLAQIGIYCVTLFVCCMVCHGELYRLKPHPRHLTGYYLMIAAGGALGGVLVGLVAPLVFNSHAELHWGLMAFALLLTLVYAREKIAVHLAGESVPIWKLALVGLIALGVTLTIQVRYAARHLVSGTRGFYGVLRVFEYNPELPEAHVYLLHCGEITHGVQFADPVQAAWPTAYYHDQSGVGLALRHLPRERDRRIGVVGLGVGTLAAYGQAGDVVRFYEINPQAKQLAETRFTYLAGSTARVEVVLGDARLSLENEPSQQFDLLALDAFSGDAIPVHLLTREALEIYLRHLKPDGVLAMHITNRHLDLLPVMENLARHFHLHWALIPFESDKREWWRYSNKWVLLTRDPAFLEQPAIREAATTPEPSARRVPLWTDDYASLFAILK